MSEENLFISLAAPAPRDRQSRRQTQRLRAQRRGPRNEARLLQMQAVRKRHHQTVLRRHLPSPSKGPRRHESGRLRIHDQRRVGHLVGGRRDGERGHKSIGSFQVSEVREKVL